MGGSMRIGIRLGGSVTWALIAVLGVTAGAQAADRVTTISLGGALENQSGDHHFGVYVPTRFGGELTITTTDGKVVELKGPNGLERTNGQEIRSEEHTSELQSRPHLVCRLLLEKKKK